MHPRQQSDVGPTLAMVTKVGGDLPTLAQRCQAGNHLKWLANGLEMAGKPVNVENATIK